MATLQEYIDDGFLSSIEIITYLSGDGNTLTRDDYVVAAADEDGNWVNPNGETMFWPNSETPITMDDVYASGFEVHYDESTGQALYFFNPDSLQILTDSAGKIVLGSAGNALPEEYVSTAFLQINGGAAPDTDTVSEMLSTAVIWANFRYRTVAADDDFSGLVTSHYTAASATRAAVAADNVGDALTASPTESATFGAEDDNALSGQLSGSAG